MRALLDSDEYDFRLDIGCGVLSSTVDLSDRDTIVQSLANYYVVVKVKAQLDQLVEGLDTLGVFDLVRANPRRGRELFVYATPQAMTADDVINMFTPKLYPQGSNRREDEEAVVMLWVNFIQMIEREFDHYYLQSMSTHKDNYYIITSFVCYSELGHCESSWRWRS